MMKKTKIDYDKIVNEVIKRLKKDEVFAEKYDYEQNTISDVVRDKKGTIIGFKNERPMKLVRGS